jgi:hypothetical protein
MCCVISVRAEQRKVAAGCMQRKQNYLLTWRHDNARPLRCYEVIYVVLQPANNKNISDKQSSPIYFLFKSY